MPFHPLFDQKWGLLALRRVPYNKLVTLQDSSQANTLSAGMRDLGFVSDTLFHERYLDEKWWRQKFKALTRLRIGG